jgi:hypothetical protein
MAAFSGQGFAFGFIGLGLWTMLGGNVSNGLWLVFIGWVFQNAAASSYAQISTQELLRHVSVDQVMSREYPEVSGNLTLQQLVEDHILTDGKRYVLVTAGDRIRGMVTLTDITKIAKADWPTMTAEQIMTPMSLRHRS